MNNPAIAWLVLAGLAAALTKFARSAAVAAGIPAVATGVAIAILADL